MDACILRLFAMAVGARLRFEILKRDAFRCRYCGSNTLSAVLEIDHVIPISGGGSDDPSNLLTACFTCKRAKSNVSLAERQLPTAISAVDLLQQADDIRNYLQAQQCVVQAREDVHLYVENYWKRIHGYEAPAILQARWPTITRSNPLELVIAAIEASISCPSLSPTVVTKYFYGCLRNLRVGPDIKPSGAEENVAEPHQRNAEQRWRQMMDLLGIAYENNAPDCARGWWLKSRADENVFVTVATSWDQASAILTRLAPQADKNTTIVVLLDEWFKIEHKEREPYIVVGISYRGRDSHVTGVSFHICTSCEATDFSLGESCRQCGEGRAIMFFDCDAHSPLASHDGLWYRLEAEWTGHVWEMEAPAKMLWALWRSTLAFQDDKSFWSGCRGESHEMFYELHLQTVAAVKKVCQVPRDACE